MTNRPSLFLMGLLIGVISGWVLADNPVLLGAEDSWPPFSGPDGKGFSNEIVTEAFRRVGREVNILVYPYARVLQFVENGVLQGGFNVTRQQSTNQSFVFGDSPILQASTSFFYHRGKEKSYRSVADIPDGTRIGLIIEYEYGDLFEEHRDRFSEQRVATQTQIIQMLLLDRVEVAIMFDKVAEYTMANMQASGNYAFDTESIIKGQRQHTSDIYVVFSRKSPDATKLAHLLDEGLHQLHADGSYDRLLRGVPPAVESLTVKPRAN